MDVTSFNSIPFYSNPLHSTLYHNSRHIAIQCYIFCSYMYVFPLYTSLQRKSSHLWCSNSPYMILLNFEWSFVQSMFVSPCVLLQVRILRSLFPPFLLELYKMLIAPIGGGKVAAIMVGESDRIMSHFTILQDDVALNVTR